MGDVEGERELINNTVLIITGWVIWVDLDQKE